MILDKLLVIIKNYSSNRIYLSYTKKCTCFAAAGIKEPVKMN